MVFPEMQKSCEICDERRPANMLGERAETLRFANGKSAKVTVSYCMDKDGCVVRSRNMLKIRAKEAQRANA